jgi:hypothetical protein
MSATNPFGSGWPNGVQTGMMHAYSFAAPVRSMGPQGCPQGYVPAAPGVPGPCVLKGTAPHVRVSMAGIPVRTR